MDDGISILLAGIVLILFLAFGGCRKIADYNFCSKHYPDETWTCLFSDRYKVIQP